MFERYNEHARRVIFFARFSASQSGSSAIESEHLLLGLVREAGSVFARMTPLLSLDDLCARIPRKIVVQNPSMRLHMPLSGECKRILSYSAEEANDMDHRYIGAEHLLIGLLRENDSLAARLLADLHVDLGELRQRLTTEVPRAGVADASNKTQEEVGRHVVHALIDRMPEGMLAPLKDVIDRMISRSRIQESLHGGDVRILKGTFPRSTSEVTEAAKKASSSGAE